jgi:hypothetical protein
MRYFLLESMKTFKKLSKDDITEILGAVFHLCKEDWEY